MDLRLNAIVPVRNGGDELALCVESLISAGLLPQEIIVVDDHSTDDAVTKIANRFPVKIVVNGSATGGPASARNYGATVAASADILLFVDADVSIHSCSIRRFKEVLLDNPDVCAVFGSYDDAPAAQNIVSQYKNLHHHFIHQNSSKNAFTFWSGCGVVRATTFRSVGGFSEKYEKPSIEDIDLGMRLIKSQQKIILCRNILCKHLKYWTFRGWIRTDFCQRAIPWTKLILSEENGIPKSMNLNYNARLSAAFATGSVLFSIIAFFVFDVKSAIFVLLVLQLVFVILQSDFLKILYQKHGACKGFVGVLLHNIYMILSCSTFVTLYILKYTMPGVYRRIAD